MEIKYLPQRSADQYVHGLRNNSPYVKIWLTTTELVHLKEAKKRCVT